MDMFSVSINLVSFSFGSIEGLSNTGDSTSGQRGLYGVGVTGIPIYNVNNNCATGSSALYLGKQIIESGNADCVLACGFEKMERGSLNSKVIISSSYLLL